VPAPSQTAATSSISSATSTSTSIESSSNSSTTATTTTSTSACQVQSDHGGSLPPWSDQLRSGGAFKKRETARILEEAEEYFRGQEETLCATSSVHSTDDENAEHQSIATQTECRRRQLTIQLDVGRVDIWLSKPRFQARQLPHCRKGVQCERVKAPKLNLLSAGPQPPVVVVDNTDSSDDDKTVPDLDGSPSASDSYQPSSRQSSDSSFEIRYLIKLTQVSLFLRPTPVTYILELKHAIYGKVCSYKVAF